MAGIPERLVVKTVNPAVKGRAHCAEPTRGEKRLEAGASDDDGLFLTHRRHHFPLSFPKHFAIVEVLVHDPFGRPDERITKESGGMLGESPDPQLDAPQI